MEREREIEREEGEGGKKRIEREQEQGEMIQFPFLCVVWRGGGRIFHKTRSSAAKQRQ